jgi:fibronectin type 3 domain-containing protein
MLRFISVLFVLSLALTNCYTQEIEFAKSTPNGLIVFAGMELANGKKVDHYTIERSYDKKQWEKVADLKSPATWNDFSFNLQKGKSEFPFQELPKADHLKLLWEKCNLYGCIDSMKYWAASTVIRLAAGIAYVDKQAKKSTNTWYRVNAIDAKGKSVSESVSSPAQWPSYPLFDKVTIADKSVDKTLFYLKWQSQGSEEALYFAVKYYENQILKNAVGIQSQYKIGDKTFYIFQDSVKNLQTDRQYFLIPLDLYGNPGTASDITIVSKSSSTLNYFVFVKAYGSKKGYGLNLAWKLKNTLGTKAIKIYRSESFDKGEYKQIATVPASDTSFRDPNIVPDRIYYYFLETESKLNDSPVKSTVFFDVAYDQLKPVRPTIVKYASIPRGVEIKIMGSDIFMAGVRVYRNDGAGGKLLPISEVLKADSGFYMFRDTSKTLTGGKVYTYAATIVNTSSTESELSNPVYVVPGVTTEPPAPNSLKAYEEMGVVKLWWEDMNSQNKYIKGYILFRRELPNGKFSPLLSNDSIIEANYFDDYSAKAGKSYEYAIRTTDYFKGKSSSMAVYSIQLKDNKLPIPGSLSLTEEAGKVVIQWGDVLTKEPLQLNIYRYQRGTKPSLIKTLSVKEPSFTDNSVKKGELYFYFSRFVKAGVIESASSEEKNIRIQ